MTEREGDDSTGESEAVGQTASSNWEQATSAFEQLLGNIEHAVVGKTEAVKLALCALLAKSHLLIEDVPGTGKTLLGKALAKSLNVQFKRVQFTPDLLPTDLTGVSIYDPKELAFEFRPGPIFSDIVLADEINRATPRAQAALLECMEERQVSVDGESRQLPNNFFVIATQNPIEQQGTFPLPEAQLDRFGLCLSFGYPDPSFLSTILKQQQFRHPLDSLSPVASREQLATMQQVCQHVEIEPSVEKYLIDLCLATREHPSVALGASTRAILTFAGIARAYAFVNKRRYVLPDDLKTLLEPVLGHRLVIDGKARLSGFAASKVLGQIAETVTVPVRSR